VATPDGCAACTAARYRGAPGRAVGTRHPLEAGRPATGNTPAAPVVGGRRGRQCKTGGGGKHRPGRGQRCTFVVLPPSTPPLPPLRAGAPGVGHVMAAVCGVARL